MHRLDHNQSKPARKLPKNLFVCNFCDHKVKSKQGLYFHKRSTHEKVYFDYELCEFKAPQRSGIKTHTESKHINIKHYCEFCDFEGSSKSSLRRHRFKLHSEQVNIFACDKCSFRTQFKSLMNKHLLSKDRKH